MTNVKPTYEDLVSIIEAQHKAMDWLAASLILATREDRRHQPFFLSKSPVFETFQAGSKILERVKGAKP